MTGKRHGFHAQWRVGFDDDGRLQALDATLTSDGGWSLDLSEPVLARALCHVDNAYWIPDVRVNGRIARTNKTSQTAFRGFGGPQGMLVIEDILGRCAPLLGLDPVELRRRNFYVDGQATPYGQPVRHAERLVHAWDDLTARAELARRRDEVASFNAAHPHTKRGLAMTPVKFGISFNFTTFNQAGALVHVYTDGSVLINHGGTEMGQGLHTKMLQVAADQPRAAARAGAPGAHAHRQGAQHLCHGSELGSRPQRRCGQAGLRADHRPAHGRGGRPPRGGALSRDHRRGRRDRRWAVALVGRARRARLRPASAAVGGGLLPHRGSALGLEGHAGLAVQVLLLRRGCGRGRGRRLHRRLPHPARRHRARRRRQPLSARRHRPDRGRIRPGRRLAHPRGPPVGRERRTGPWPLGDAVGEHLQAALTLRDARGLQRLAPRARPRGRRRLRLQGGRRAPAHAGLLGPGGTAPGGGRLRTRRRRRPPRHAGHPGGGVVGHRVGSVAVPRRPGVPTGRARRW